MASRIIDGRHSDTRASFAMLATVLFATFLLATLRCDTLLTETRISLPALAREQNVAVSTVWRWTLRPIRGHLLESFSVGGRRFTTREAFARFIARTNGEPVPPRSTRQREREQRIAKADLTEAGLM
jgi:hypothetical protein